MDEEHIQPVETESAETAPAQEVPAQAAPAVSGTSRKGSPLLVFLTVLLVLVGIADAILWGIVGYYALQNYLGGDEPVQSISAGGTAAGDRQTVDNGEASGDAGD